MKYFDFQLVNDFSVCFSALGQALAAGFESCSDKNLELEKLFVQICRLLHRAEKDGPGLAPFLQMCLVNLISQILESCVDNDAAADCEIEDDDDDDDASADDVKIKSVLASLLHVPACEAKTLCLTKMKIFNEPVA